MNPLNRRLSVPVVALASTVLGCITLIIAVLAPAHSAPLAQEHSATTVVAAADAYVLDRSPDTNSGNRFPQAGTVILTIQPLTRTVAAGRVFTVSVQLDAGSQWVDGAEIHLDFDPQIVQVVDASGNPTSTIEAGTSLPLLLQNSAHNVAGTIDYAAGADFPPQPPVTGRFTVATIRLKALRPTSSTGTPLAFVFTLPRRTDVSFEEQSVLGPHVDGRVVVLRQIFLPLVRR